MLASKTATGIEGKVLRGAEPKPGRLEPRNGKYPLLFEAFKELMAQKEGLSGWFLINRAKKFRSDVRRKCGVQYAWCIRDACEVDGTIKPGQRAIDAKPERIKVRDMKCFQGYFEEWYSFLGCGASNLDLETPITVLAKQIVRGRKAATRLAKQYSQQYNTNRGLPADLRIRGSTLYTRDAEKALKELRKLNAQIQYEGRSGV